MDVEFEKDFLQLINLLIIMLQTLKLEYVGQGLYRTRILKLAYNDNLLTSINN